MAALSIDFLDERVFRVGHPATPQRLHDDAMFRLHLIEDAREITQRLRHRQHAKRVSRGCGIDDYQVVTAGPRQTRDFEQGRQFVDSRQRQPQQPGYIFPIEPGAAQRDTLERLAPLRKPALECSRCIDLDAVQETAPEGNAARSGSEGAIECVAQRRCGIGGNYEGPVPCRGRDDRDGRGASRLADAPLSPDEAVPGTACERGRGELSPWNARRLRPRLRCP